MKFKSVHLIIEEVKDARHLPGTWPIADDRKLLNLLDFDGEAALADAEVPDMTVMALQDLEAEEAMRAVLTNFTGGLFTKGQIQNLLEELKEVSAWEEYPSIEHQRALYVCVDLLHDAFPHLYPEPAACSVRLTLAAPELTRAHADHPLDAATVLRAVGRIHETGSILNRFFPDQIGGAPFPEADSVVWHLEVTAGKADQLVAQFYGSAYWFRGLDEVEEGTCALDWPDD